MLTPAELRAALHQLVDKGQLDGQYSSRRRAHREMEQLMDAIMIMYRESDEGTKPYRNILSTEQLLLGPQLIQMLEES